MNYSLYTGKLQNSLQNQIKKGLFSRNFDFDLQNLSPTFSQKYELSEISSPTNSNQKRSNQPSNYLKLGSLDGKINQQDELYEKYQLSVIRSGTQSEKRSQVISIHQITEEYPPLLMSRLNFNFKRNLNNLLIGRVKNNLQQLRQAQSDILSYVQEIRTSIQFYKEKICLEIEHFMNNLIQKQREISNTSLVRQIYQSRQNIRNLDQDIKQRNQQIYQLNKDLNQTKSLLQKQMKKNISLTSMKSLIKFQKRQQRQIHPDSRSNNCPKCQISSIKNKTLVEQIKRTQQQKESLLIQNQSLQQYIFDIEQKIVGIDLEVQKRLKDYLQSNPHFQQNRYQERQNKDYEIIIQKLNDENITLEKKIDKLQQICIKQQEIKEREERLREKEIDYRRREDSLLQSLNKNEEIRENNYFREHQIQLAEQNLAAKIKQQREKQLENQELEHKKYFMDYIPPQKQMNRSLTSGQAWQGGEISFMRLEKQINSQKMLKNKQKNYASTSRQLHAQHYEDSSFFDKNHFQHNDHYSARSRYTNEKMTKMNSARNVEIKPRNSYAWHSPSPPSKFRQSSRVSNKIGLISPNFQLKRPQTSRQNPQVYGWENKLQRLRKQIKKEIQAIR